MIEGKTTPASSDWVSEMNRLSLARIPFLFILDFELNNPIILPIDSMSGDIYYKFRDVRNYTLSGNKSKPLVFQTFPVPYAEYKKSFDKVKSHILYGNSFLINLTFPTPVESNHSLRELFDIAQARYKLYFKDRFIVFSPETFVQISTGKIRTFPMKGTIDASVEDAARKILEDPKETAEHHTIVDLLRNDLSLVARHVSVRRFRYIDEIRTYSKTLLQVSSEIEGTLTEPVFGSLGDIFRIMLPAGSISGAPKKKTVEIIKEAEPDERGFYTGVFGIFDGENVDSAVMIRFIEKTEGKLTYRSGCGITSMSDCESEYREMIDKVYVPVGRKY